MNYETISIDRKTQDAQTIVVITLNRPDVRNAINQKMILELGQVLDETYADDSVRALIFTGAGESAFAAGADIRELKERGAKEALMRINAALFRRIEEHPKPSIAAIRGFALGGGCELAMACDLRVAGENSKFGQPELHLGIIPGAGAIQRLPRLVGLSRAKEIVLTGQILSADEALSIGLVNRVVQDHDVLVEAEKLAWKIAEQGPLAVSIAKLALNASGSTSNMLDSIDALGQAVLFESEEKHRRMEEFIKTKENQRIHK